MGAGKQPSTLTQQSAASSANPSQRPTSGAASPPRVIAFINQKGGVGKTTTTVNIAAALAKAGKRTLLVDLDPQAHASLHVGIGLGDTKPARTVYDLLLDWDDEYRSAPVKVRENLWLLASETDLAAIEVELTGQPDRNRRLTRALTAMAPDYDAILLDCPPSLGLLTLNALAAAREVVIPMQAHFLALQGVSKLLETVRIVNEKLNPRLRVAGVVLCMLDAQSAHSQEVVRDLEDFFSQAKGQGVPWKDGRVLRPAIRRNIKLAECPSFGQTIFDYAPTAPGAADYSAVAAALWSSVTHEPPTATFPSVATPAKPSVSAAAASATGGARA